MGVSGPSGRGPLCLAFRGLLLGAALASCATDSRSVGTVEADDCASPPCESSPGTVVLPGTATANEMPADGGPPSSSESTPPAAVEVSGLAGGSACLSESRSMSRLPAALYLMLDSSGSMAEISSGVRSKWDAIQGAVRGFLTETQQGDLQLGMQFFPLLKPGTKFVCTSESDCGPDGGPCFLKTCVNASEITLCRSDADCEGGSEVNPCVTFGLCSGSDPSAPLACVLDDNASCGSGLGTCQEFERTCTNATSCDPAAYATPAVEIAPVVNVTGAIDQALTQKLPEGLTPTVPALQGALDHARTWSRAHAGQPVAVVLATDGLPTECNSQQSGVSTEALNQVLSIAAAASADVRTYVIGVFKPGDAASASNIDAIAQAGGTDRAVLIDANGEVEQQFLGALRSVRTAAAACVIELQSARALDFARAELQLDPGDGRASLVPYVGSLLGCAARPEGWYYDQPPAQGQPSRAELCPGLCQLLRAAPTAGLQLQIGCAQ